MKPVICFLYNANHVQKNMKDVALQNASELNHLPEEERKEKRKGKKNGIMIFNKSRERMDGLMKNSR